MTDEEAGMTQGRTDATDGAGAVRALIVEDDFAVAALHRRYVESVAGFEVAAVLDRGEAVAETAARLDVDLVLLDVHLPDRSGVDVLGDLRAAGLGVGVIMVTAAQERDTVRRALDHRADGYLVKPFRREELEARLLAFAADHRAAAQAPGGEELSQAEIDRLLAGGRATPSGSAPGSGTGTDAAAPADGPLPKGYAAPTLRRVADALRAAPEGATLSAREVAAACEVSRVSARRYLDLLVTRGQAELTPQYGRAGRPEHRFRWTGG